MSTPILPAILSCQSTQLSSAEKHFFARYNPLGINLFSRNIADKSQLQQLISDIKETIGREDVLIAIDQEGGRVRRLVEPEFPSYAAAVDIGSLPYEQASRAAFLHASLISGDLNQLGINVNYAPVLDTAYPQTSQVLYSRCFGSDASLITKLGKIEVDTYLKSGIIPCIKHLPGHGRATVDPHLNLPYIDSSLSALANDFLPFKNLNYCPMAMTAHIILEAVDNLRPITQSPLAIKQLIRDLIGFDGLLISDAIDMKALKGSIGEKARTALSAGCDVVCYALGNLSEMQEIADSCNPMSDKSLERFAKIKKILHTQPQIGTQSVSEYHQLISTVAPYQEKYDATEVLHHLQHSPTGEN